jgi:hypothetical protein
VGWYGGEIVASSLESQVNKKWARRGQSTKRRLYVAAVEAVWEFGGGGITCRGVFVSSIDLLKDEEHRNLEMLLCGIISFGAADVDRLGF